MRLFFLYFKHIFQYNVLFHSPFYITFKIFMYALFFTSFRYLCSSAPHSNYALMRMYMVGWPLYYIFVCWAYFYQRRSVQVGGKNNFTPNYLPKWMCRCSCRFLFSKEIHNRCWSTKELFFSNNQCYAGFEEFKQ